MSKLYDLLNTLIGKVNTSVKTVAQTMTAEQKAQARQNIGAAAVGETGASSWEDLPDKPFGEVSGRNTITLAANLTGFQNAKENGHGWFKVSNAVVTAENITAEALFVWYGEDGLYSDQLPVYTEIGADGVIRVKAIDLNGNEHESVQFRSDGVFFYLDEAQNGPIYPVSITLPGYGKFSVAKPIDTKYLPGALQFGEVSGSDTWKPSGNLIEQATDIIANMYGVFFKVSEVIATLEDCSLSGSVSVNSQMYAPDNPAWFAVSNVNGVVAILHTDENGYTTEAAYCYAEGLDHDPGIYIREDVQVLTINGFTGFTTSKKIDEKYLPESGGGNPSWEDLPDKPFGVVGGSNTISIAANPVGFKNCQSGVAYKVSDIRVTEADIKEGANVVWYTSDGNSNYYIVSNELEGTELSYEVYDDGSININGTEYANGNPYTIVQFRPDGVYFIVYNEPDWGVVIYPIAITLPGFGKFPINKPIDTEYLPESLRFGDIPASAVWRREDNIIEKATDVIVTQDGSYLKISDTVVPFEIFSSIAGNMDFRMGEENIRGWFVDYGDGEDYSVRQREDGVIVIPLADDYGNYYMDAALMYPEGLDHEPGLYVYYSPNGDGVLSFEFEAMTFPVAQKIDQKYLPKAEAVPNAAGDTVTREEFNALLAALRAAGYLAQ